MFTINKEDKIFFLENGYLIKKGVLEKNTNFIKTSNDFKEILEGIAKDKKIKNLGGFKSGNLNINPGLYGQKILSQIKDMKFEFFFNHLTEDNILEYKTRFGGNLNLPKSKNQLFHTDGNWNPRMLILNIATSEINTLNGPMEICEKSHKINYPYWKFFFKKFFMKKKKILLNYGDVIIREHRLWHRGTINKSLKNREMISIMFIKMKTSENVNNNDFKNDVEIFSNVFGLTKKEKIKETIFCILNQF